MQKQVIKTFQESVTPYKASNMRPITSLTHMIKLIHTTIFIGLSLPFLSGCASAPVYSEAKKSGDLDPRHDAGLVLIYYAPGGSAGPSYKVYANDKLLFKLRRGGFYSYHAPPG